MKHLFIINSQATAALQEQLIEQIQVPIRIRM